MVYFDLNPKTLQLGSGDDINPDAPAAVKDSPSVPGDSLCCQS